MEQLERDLLLLTARVDRNREWMDYHVAEIRGLVADHTRQLHILSTKPPPASDPLPIFGASLKLVVALLFPLLVLALTGDLKQALAALKLVAPG